MSARTALHKIFVYGTLKTGQPNHYVLKGPGVAQLVGAAKLAKRYPLVVATRYGIPGLLAREGSGQVVHGELYEVDDVMLKVLDELEDHPTLYTRTPALCHLLHKHTSPPSPSTAPPSPPPHTPADAQVPATSASGSGLGSESSVECEVYLIFDFNKKLLELPHLSCYDNKTAGQTEYTTRAEREEAQTHIYSEMKQEIKLYQ